jgi:hypothetical protein
MARSLALPTLLVAAVSAPYVATHAPEWKQQWLNGATSAAQPAVTPATAPAWPGVGDTFAGKAMPSGWSPSSPTASAPPAILAARPAPAVAPLEGAPSYSLAEVLRLDATKEWVYQRWPRKSTALSELDLYGVRVPLVTGTQLYDLAGSLTYFFTPDGRVQRLSFRGRTGDTTQIVALVTQRYGFQWQTPTAAGEQLLQVRKGEEILCELRTRPAPVLWANSPNNSFSVNLELQNPANARPLAPIAAPLPPPPPAASATKGAAGHAGANGAGEPPPSGWKALHPRSRTPANQIQNLDRYNRHR